MKSDNKINVIFVFSVYDLPILAPQSVIYAYIQNFMLILTEIRIFDIFNFFSIKWPYIIIKNSTNRLNKTRAFDWCINYHI